MSDMASNTPFLLFKTTGNHKIHVEVYIQDLIGYCIIVFGILLFLFLSCTRDKQRDTTMLVLQFYIKEKKMNGHKKKKKKKREKREVKRPSVFVNIYAPDKASETVHLFSGDSN